MQPNRENKFEVLRVKMYSESMVCKYQCMSPLYAIFVQKYKNRKLLVVKPCRGSPTAETCHNHVDEDCTGWPTAWKTQDYPLRDSRGR